VTYIKYKWYKRKGMHRKNNREQEVLRERKLEKAKWYGCPKQRMLSMDSECS